MLRGLTNLVWCVTMRVEVKRMKYRKKPVVIDAIQWTGKNTTEVAIFLEGHTNDRGRVDEDRYIIIPTLEGDHKTNVGDWIIKGVKGEFYPCKPDIFTISYELVY